MDTLALLVLVMLHAASGHEVFVNPDSVVMLRTGKPGKPNEYIAGDAKCVLNTADGKFIGVTETCDEVRLKFEQSRTEQGRTK
jgi:hypothetical protein